MTLRMRAIIASAVAVALLVAMCLVVLVVYAVTTLGSRALLEAISPLSDKAAALSLAQANASGAVSDYVLLERPRSLRDYRQSIAEAERLLKEIDDAVPQGDVPELDVHVTKARAAQEAWVATDAEPTITAMQSGQRAKAIATTNARAAWTSYDEMTEASSALSVQVNEVRDEFAEAVRTFNAVLGVTLLVIAILAALGLVGFMVGMRAWILAPLRHLRGDLQSAAKAEDHGTVIRAIGPPELRDVARDAESLRRSLVEEIDEARAAREGLLQDAPLVAAMRAELDAGPPIDVPGLAVHGLVKSAEGVAAGDWWDRLPGPDGTLAIVVADVSGHGPSASVSALRIRSLLRSGLAEGGSLPDVVATAARSCGEDDHFATAIILRFDITGGTVSWVNAGHHPAILVTQDKEATLLEPTGPLISSLGGSWQERSAYFRPGDVVVAFTDGLVESRNADGDELESSMVSQIIRGMDAHVRENPQELVTRLLAQVRHRAADWRRDDVTIAAVSRPR
jgi:CHASE3 domain sensor protein